jgi:hypothetical protein
MLTKLQVIFIKKDKEVHSIINLIIINLNNDIWLDNDRIFFAYDFDCLNESEPNFFSCIQKSTDYLVK